MNQTLHLLDLKPILSLDQDGRISPVDRVRGRRALLPRIVELLDELLPSVRERLRLGVVHADVPRVAEEVRRALVTRFNPLEVIVSMVTPVIAAHAGPGAWGVAWQIEDGPVPPVGPGHLAGRP